MVTFYLGVHNIAWMRRTNVPMCVSWSSLRKMKKLLPSTCRWILDSGGFSELSLHGQWTRPHEEYRDAVREYALGIGGMDWCAPQDWMCEPWLLQKTGMSVAEHQRRTIASYLRCLRDNLPVVPVLQGWEVSDYLDHIHMYAAAGVDLARQPVVCIGSVCRRQHTDGAVRLIRRLKDEGLSMHGFGLKLTSLLRVQHDIVSSDSMAWSYTARRMKGPFFPSHTHMKCNNCMDYALGWRDSLLRRLSDADNQLRLW